MTPTEWVLQLAGEGDAMQRINPYNFYQLGSSVHGLSHLKDGHEIKDVILVLLQAANWLTQYIAQGVIPARMNQDPAQKVLNAIRDITGQPNFPNSPPSDPKKVLDFYDVYVLTEAMKEFEIVLSYDLPKLDTYCVSRKGIYETADLVSNSENMFDDEVRPYLEQKAIEDIRQSGRCLAFECPTASGFHIARALETTLLGYLNILCPSEVATLRPPERNLGRYIDMARDNGGDTNVCAALDQFRTLHRNPLMHPETVLTTNTAMALFGITDSTIRSILLDTIKRQNQLILPVVPTSVNP